MTFLCVIETSEAKFPGSALLVPNLSFEFSGDFFLFIPHFGLFSPQRFHNFPRCSCYFLVPEIWGKLGNPGYSLIFPENYIFKKGSYFKNL